MRRSLRLYVGNRQMLIVQEFQNLSLIMQDAFGSAEEGDVKSGARSPQPQVVENEAQLMSFMKAFN